MQTEHHQRHAIPRSILPPQVHRTLRTSVTVLQPPSADSRERVNISRDFNFGLDETDGQPADRQFLPVIVEFEHNCRESDDTSRAATCQAGQMIWVISLAITRFLIGY